MDGLEATILKADTFVKSLKKQVLLLFAIE